MTVIRPPLIYGPRDRESFAVFQSVASGVLPLAGDGENTLSVIYVSDAATACVRALSANVPSGSAFFVDDGQVHRWRELLREIERQLDIYAPFRTPIPFWLMRRIAKVTEWYGARTGKAVMLSEDKLNELLAPHWVCESVHTRRELGWAPEVSWSEGVRRALAWYREQGWLRP